MSPKEFSEALDRIRDGFLHTMAVEPDTIKKYGGVWGTEYIGEEVVSVYVGSIEVYDKVTGNGI